METIEVIKSVLTKNIFRTFSNKSCNWHFMCLHTFDCIPKLMEKFPTLVEEDLQRIISKEIFVKNGQWTSFISGYSKAARQINNLLKQ